MSSISIKVMMTMITLLNATQWLAFLKVLYIQKPRQNSQHRSKAGTNRVHFSEENWRRLTRVKKQAPIHSTTSR